MKNYQGFVSGVLFIFAFVIFGNINAFAQKTGLAGSNGGGPAATIDDLRPFDFSDKYYALNGVQPGKLIGRPTGEDGLSVPDITGDQDHNNVRILATRPAYGTEGETLYWNFYGGFFKDGFTWDNEGNAAYNLVYDFPVYIFPGESRSKAERQSPVIDLTAGYFEKNVLGLGALMLVEYNYNAVRTKMDAAFLEQLAKQNGLSTDGTPIIRTVKELDQLRRRNLVIITPNDARGQVPYIIGRVLQYPEHGAIAPDAFLLYTMDAQGKPLESELFFLEKFNCLQKYGSACSQ
jgi:hypothetical protein